MKTEWDYSTLAKPYINRPEYSNDALQEVWSVTDAHKDAQTYVCDVGAGVGHLTIPMLDEGFRVDAVEPNDEMRALGKQRTASYDTVRWFEGTGEKTGRDTNTYDLVTFGSSFNVTDQSKALIESDRILKKNGWFVCMWNHRDLEDPTQKEVENIIKSYIPNYNYGTRRNDQTEIIESSHLFSKVHFVKGKVLHVVSKKDWVDAWNSHATLARQAANNFSKVVNDIEAYVDTLPGDKISIPYTTRIWFSQKR